MIKIENNYGKVIENKESYEQGRNDAIAEAAKWWQNRADAIGISLYQVQLFTEYMKGERQ